VHRKLYNFGDPARIVTGAVGQKEGEPGIDRVVEEEDFRRALSQPIRDSL